MAQSHTSSNKPNGKLYSHRGVIHHFKIGTELYCTQYFSKIYLNEGYHQILLDEHSHHTTTFATHEGIYRYKCLIYDISSTFESFQKQIEIAISGCNKAKNIVMWRNSGTF